MNRTIKFRIWNPVEKKMVESGGTPSMLSGFFHQTATLDTVHNMPYQQFTGLHDKNGKDCYEGDILRVQEDGDEHEAFEVVFSDGCFKTKHPQISAEYLVASWDKFEIIGNIYENPELLNPPTP